MSMMTMKWNVPVTIKKEDDVFVALCPLLDVASQGCTVEEARSNLAEALRLFLFTCIEMGTLSQVLKDCGFTQLSQQPSFESGMEHLDIVLPFRSDFNSTECHA